MSFLRELALAQMIQWAAEGKGEVPPGSNLGDFVASVLAPAGLTPPQPYCASAVSMAFKLAAAKLGLPMPFGYSPGALNLLHLCEVKGFGIERDKIQPGDLVFWRRGAVSSGQGHVGIVQFGRNPTTGAIQTVEANHSSRVDHFHYDRGGWDDERFAGAIRVPG